MSLKAIGITRRQADRFKMYGRHSAAGYDSMIRLAEIWQDKDPEIARLYEERGKHYAELIEIYAEMADDATELVAALEARARKLGVGTDVPVLREDG